MPSNPSPAPDLLTRLREAATPVGEFAIEVGDEAPSYVLTPEQVQRGLERMHHDMDWDADYFDAVLRSFLKGAGEP